LQVSVVHTFVSAHSPSVVQQFAIGACPHAPVVVLQVSVVQAFESLQSPTAVQQFGLFVYTHAKFGSSQVSVVQLLLSLQSESASQQSGTRLFWQTLATQMSVVQTDGSAHSALVVHGSPAAWRTCPVTRSGLPPLEHAAEAATAKASKRAVRKNDFMFVLPELQ
jgi:hypothetical protein